MVSSLPIQHLYEYSNLSSFEVTSKESFLSTVNNGKALSMTILYAYMYGLFWKGAGALLFSPLRFYARHKQILPLIEEQYLYCEQEVMEYDPLNVKLV